MTRKQKHREAEEHTSRLRAGDRVGVTWPQQLCPVWASFNTVLCTCFSTWLWHGRVRPHSNLNFDGVSLTMAYSFSSFWLPWGWMVKIPHPKKKVGCLVHISLYFMFFETSRPWTLSMEREDDSLCRYLNPRQWEVFIRWREEEEEGKKEKGKGGKERGERTRREREIGEDEGKEGGRKETGGEEK